MKRLFSLLSLMLVMLTACEKPQEESVTSLTILSESIMDFDFRGGKGLVLYELKNPKPDVTLLVSDNDAAWITDIKTNDGATAFVVERNGGSEERLAILKFTYGDIVQEVAVRQGVRAEGEYDYDMKATIFGGEYYGMNLNDNFNYYVQVGDGEINENNDAPNATYYYFDLYSKHRGGSHPILPNGTYTLDTTENFPIGTFSAKYSKAHINNEFGEPDTEFTIAAGELTVTDNRFEAVLEMIDGTLHHVVFEGELHVPYAVESETPEVATTLTDDLIFEHNGAMMRLFYYGDYYECGCDYWSIALMESVGPINGDYFMIDIITDALNEGASEDNVIGTYAACSDLDIKPNSFLVGVMEGAAYINSWRLVVEDDYIINGNGRVPMTAGSVKIEREGNGFLVTIDSMDDANHKVQGTFSCGGVEIYDRSKR